MIPHAVYRNSASPQFTSTLSDFEKTSFEEVKLIMNSLKQNASLGHDKISLRLLKSLGSSFIHYITGVINDNFSRGIFPDSLKLAKVLPLYKDSDPKNCDNYSPISVLSVLSKISETVIKIRLENHLISNNLIHKNQFGFMKKSNTTAAAVNFLRTIYDNLNKGTHQKNRVKVGAVFLDLRKAFDSCSHSLLLVKLKNYVLAEFS